MKWPQKLTLIPALLLLSIPVVADDMTPTTGALEAAAELSAAPANEETMLDLGAFESEATLSDEELNTHRARENIEVEKITINDQDQDGDVTDNVAIGNTNGDNLINGEAFSNSSGFLSTVQNTGNNVLIQNSTIINVTVETPPSN